jgi:hypothetical protein
MVTNNKRDLSNLLKPNKPITMKQYVTYAVLCAVGLRAVMHAVMDAANACVDM